MAVNPEPLPFSDRIVNIRRRDLKPSEIDPNEGKVTAVWQQRLSAQGEQIAQAASRVALVELEDQAASVVTTPLVAEGGAGLYRIAWYAQILVPDGVSSSLTISFFWTNVVSLSVSGSAITGNLTTTFQSGSLMIRSDGSAPISYSTTYVSGGGGPAMEYSLDVAVESVAA